MAIWLLHYQLFIACSAILESTLNRVSTKVNLSHISVAVPFDILLANDIPVTHLAGETRIIFNPKSLLYLSRWIWFTKDPTLMIRYANKQ